jgi:hypothetical protein
MMYGCCGWRRNNVMSFSPSDIFFVIVIFQLLFTSVSFHASERQNNQQRVARSVLFGPLLYLYTQSVLYKDFSLSLRKWVHFLPFILLFLIMEVYWRLQTPVEKQVILHNILSRKVATSQYWDSGLIFGQFFLYMAASIRLIRRFKKGGGGGVLELPTDQYRLAVLYDLLFYAHDGARCV